MLFTPPTPCHKLSHLLGPPPPSSVTYFMDGPKTLDQIQNIYEFKQRHSLKKNQSKKTSNLSRLRPTPGQQVKSAHGRAIKSFVHMPQSLPLIALWFCSHITLGIKHTSYLLFVALLNSKKCQKGFRLTHFSQLYTCTTGSRCTVHGVQSELTNYFQRKARTYVHRTGNSMYKLVYLNFGR